MKTLINTTEEFKNFSVDIDHGDRKIAHKICFEPNEASIFSDAVAEILLKFEGIELKGISGVGAEEKKEEKNKEEEKKEVDISILSKRELKDFALNKGIKLDGTEKKKELIEKIQK